MNFLRSMLASLLALSAASAFAADWVAAPSYFTHEPETGARVAQYAQHQPVFYVFDPTYVRSGYHHTRSTIRVGQTFDHLHLVEEWGRPVRPYGEWQFPYRPYSVPYPLWGPPFAGLTIVSPWHLYGGYGSGGYPGAGGGAGSAPPYPGAGGYGAPSTPPPTPWSGWGN